MADYQRDPKRVDAALRKSGIVVVMNKSHIETPEHMVTTMKAVYEAGYVAEVTFRICLLYTSPSPRDLSTSRMPSSA